MDTNVIVAGLRSSLGASHEILRLLRLGRWTLVLSNTVVSEYHEILHRESGVIGLNHEQSDAYLDVLCELAEKFTPVTEWQPAAADPDDEPIVQLAREAKVLYLITHNIRGMRDAERFGVRVVRPVEFLEGLRKVA